MLKARKPMRCRKVMIEGRVVRTEVGTSVIGSIVLPRTHTVLT